MDETTQLEIKALNEKLNRLIKMIEGNGNHGLTGRVLVLEEREMAMRRKLEENQAFHDEIEKRQLDMEKNITLIEKSVREMSDYYHQQQQRFEKTAAEIWRAVIVGVISLIISAIMRAIGL